jgi:hypothetical protein
LQGSSKVAERVLMSETELGLDCRSYRFFKTIP